MSDVEMIEISMAQAKEQIAMKAAMDRLFTSRDFKKVFLKNYFETEAIRLVVARANPALQSEADQKEILKHIDAIGSVKAYMNTVRVQGDMASRALGDHEEALTEALQEELEGGSI